MNWYLNEFRQDLDESEIITKGEDSEFLLYSGNTLRKYNMSGFEDGSMTESLVFIEAEIIKTGYTPTGYLYVLLDNQLSIFASELKKPIIQENLNFRPENIIFSSNDSLIFIWNSTHVRLIRNNYPADYKNNQFKDLVEITTGLRTVENDSEPIDFSTWEMLRHKLSTIDQKRYSDF